MLKIKLTQRGKRNQRSFRIVVNEARSSRDGKYIEKIGHWIPHLDELKIDKKRLKYWINKGAKKTEGVKKLLNDNRDSKKPKAKDQKPEKKSSKKKSKAKKDSEKPKAKSSKSKTTAKKEKGKEKKSKSEKPKTKKRKEKKEKNK